VPAIVFWPYMVEVAYPGSSPMIYVPLTEPLGGIVLIVRAVAMVPVPYDVVVSKPGSTLTI